MKRSLSDDDFIDRMNTLLPFIKTGEEKIVFVEQFFRTKLGINEIDDTCLSIPDMQTKVFIFLFVGLLLDYDDRNNGIPVHDDLDQTHDSTDGE